MGMQHFIEDNIRFEILFVMWILFFWKLYLSLRQRKLMTSLETPPSLLEGYIPLDVYQKSRSYALDKNTYTNCSDLCFNIVHTVFILTFAHHYFWQWGIQLMESIGMRGGDPKLIDSVGCMLVLNAVTTITDLPLQIYNVFFLDEKYGLNKQTPWFFIRDQWNKFTMMQVKHLPRALLITPEALFFPKVWLVCAMFALCKLVLYPEVIAPFWEKYSLLPEGELKEGIQALAASVDFPLCKVYIVAGAKRSSENEVKLYGFNKNKKIVLFDTLVKGFNKPVDGEEDRECENDEVVAVIAHELGHWKYGHKIKKLLLPQVRRETIKGECNILISFLVAMVLFSVLLDYNAMYVAFGFTDTQPLFISLTILMMYILNPITTVMDFLQNMICRRYELQADQFAKKLGHAEPLKRAVIKMREDSLAYPAYDPLYSNFHLSHLSLLDHFKALDKTE